MQLMIVSFLMASAASAAMIDITGSFNSVDEGQSVSISGPGLTFQIGHPTGLTGRGAMGLLQCDVGETCAVDFPFMDDAFPGQPFLRIATASYNGITLVPDPSTSGYMKVDLLISGLPTLVTSPDTLDTEGLVSGRIRAWTENNGDGIPFLDFMISGTGSMNVFYNFPLPDRSQVRVTFTGTATDVPEPAPELTVLGSVMLMIGLRRFAARAGQR